MQRRTVISIGVVIGVTGLLAWVWYSTPSDSAGSLHLGGTTTERNTASAAQTPRERAQAQAPDTLRSSVPSGKEEYVHPSPVFSILHPSAFSSTWFEEGGSDVVLLQKKGRSDEGGVTIQITVSSYDEPTSSFTLERIKKDVGDIDIRKPQEVTAGKTGKGVTFLSSDILDSESREVWFVRDGWLYQISAPTQLEDTVYNVLSSIRFRSSSS